MNQDTDAIIAALKELLANVNGPAEAMWSIYRQQAINEGISGLVAAVVVITALTWAGIYLCRYGLAKKRAMGYWDDESEVPIFCTAVVAVIVAILIPVTLSYFLMAINPEYYAAKEILKQLLPPN